MNKVITTSIESKFTTIENLNIHYQMAGKGDCILLIHGWPTSSYLWRNMMPELAKDFQVIAIDLPGFGLSEKRLEASYSFRFYERIIDGLLKNLNIQKVTLGLHDLGGPFGLFWAIHNLEKLQSLILFNTLIYSKFSNTVKFFGFASILPGLKQLLTSPAGLKRAMYFGVHQKEKLTNEIILKYQLPFREKETRKVLLKTFQRLSVKGFQEIEKNLHSLKVPIQIIYGEKDRILPDVAKTMERLKNELAHAQLHSLPNCGHFLQEEEPKEISQIIRVFMLSQNKVA